MLKILNAVPLLVHTQDAFIDSFIKHAPSAGSASFPGTELIAMGKTG